MSAVPGSGGPGSPVDPSDPRPPEPFNSGGRDAAPWAITNPNGLRAAGGVFILLGLVLPYIGISGAAQPVPATTVLLIGLLGLAFVALGIFAIWYGGKRAAWLRDLIAWQQRHPGQT